LGVLSETEMRAMEYDYNTSIIVEQLANILLIQENRQENRREIIRSYKAELAKLVETKELRLLETCWDHSHNSQISAANTRSVRIIPFANISNY